MLKITRRPYTSCPYLWELEVAGISVGEGACSEAQCEELNGTHLLTYRPCASKGQKLVWETDCESGGDNGGPPRCRFVMCPDIPVPNRIPWTSPSYTLPSGPDYSTTRPFSTSLINPFPFDMSSGDCCWNNYEILKATTGDKSDLPDAEPEAWISNSDGTFTVYIMLILVFTDQNTGPPPLDKLQIVISSRYQNIPTTGGIGFGGEYRIQKVYAIDGITECQPEYTLGEAAVIDDDVLCTGTFGVGSVYATPPFGGWSTSVTIRPGVSSTDDGKTGPETGDATRGKFRLEYDIPTETFTLHSFERVLYPKWTLSDASPCDGDTKTLLLADKGDAADGCGVAPAEVTITRVCPPDRVGKSALLEDRKPNGATGKRKRQCGCDCLDEVDDRRHTCETKCASAATEGCERIDPAPDDITCRYPEAINCCEPTAGKDVPCAYTVEFECDLFFDIEDVRHKIAAKQVTLRRECYFEDPCLFVAPGPESSTGGSPVMDTDGFPGAQPVCASCADPCLTGCTWSAWTVAACPDVVGDCYPRCDLCWTVPIGEIQVNGVVAFTGDTITLVPVGGVPSSNYSVYGPAAAEAGYEIYVQIKVTGCEVSAIIDITSNVDECPTRPTRPYPVHYQFRYGDNGGIGACNPQAIGECNDLTVITIVSCGNDGPDCGSLITGTAPLSLTFTKVDCP